LLCGCSARKLNTTLTSPYHQTTTIAVAPVLNFSGESDLDTLKATDILYSELQQVEGLAVVPVNRVLAQMAQDNIDAIKTPQQACDLAERLGAQAIVVAAITEYDPYYPPVVGLALQLYGFKNDQASRPAFDPVELERLAAPQKIKLDPNPRDGPKSQVLRIYNGRDRDIVKQVKRFAKARGTGTSPYKWELYLRSQMHYLRFVCHQAICELLEQEAARMDQSFLSDHQEYN